MSALARFFRIFPLKLLDEAAAEATEELGVPEGVCLAFVVIAVPPCD